MTAPHSGRHPFGPQHGPKNLGSEKPGSEKPGPAKPGPAKQNERLARRESTAGACDAAAEAARILAERARVLARPAAPPVSAGALIEVITFSLARERYAIETAYVREVVRISDFTPVPGAPLFLAGLMNYRGDILALFDLRKLFGLSGQGIKDLTRVVVLGRDRPELGIVVEESPESALLLRGEIHSPPELIGGQHQLLMGVAPDALSVLDGSKVLTDARLFVNQPSSLLARVTR